MSGMANSDGLDPAFSNSSPVTRIDTGLTDDRDAIHAQSRKDAEILGPEASAWPEHFVAGRDIFGHGAHVSARGDTCADFKSVAFDSGLFHRHDGVGTHGHWGPGRDSNGLTVKDLPRKRSARAGLADQVQSNGGRHPCPVGIFGDQGETVHRCTREMGNGCLRDYGFIQHSPV